MSYRYMRIFVFFDLPTGTPDDLREYRKFRKELLNMGFMMLQESIYTKIALNGSVENSLREKIRKNKPKRGLVQVLSVTEKQYANMETIIGSIKTEKVDTDERFLVL